MPQLGVAYPKSHLYRSGPSHSHSKQDYSDGASLGADIRRSAEALSTGWRSTSNSVQGRSSRPPLFHILTLLLSHFINTISLEKIMAYDIRLPKNGLFFPQIQGCCYIYSYLVFCKQLWSTGTEESGIKIVKSVISVVPLEELIVQDSDGSNLTSQKPIKARFVFKLCKNGRIRRSL